MDSNSDVEILDVEDYRGKSDLQFSHQKLVMKVMLRCIENGCKEMKVGYYNKKTDKSGNVNMVYIPDSRKEFIESVKSAEMVMSCDVDETATEEIKKIQEEIEKELKQLCIIEKDNWGKCGANIKRNRWKSGIFHEENRLNKNLPYYQEYLELTVNAYRKIFHELTKLTKRLFFFAEEEYEN